MCRWVIEPKMLVVRSRPSPKLSEKKDSDEKERLNKQVTELGDEGLKKHEEILEAAKEENEEPTPDEVIGAITLPDINSISWITVQGASTVAGSKEIKVEKGSEALAAHLNADACTLPFNLHFDHVTVSTVSLLHCVGDV
jgi:Zn-dependent M16 (insulinase) family peptidase